MHIFDFIVNLAFLRDSTHIRMNIFPLSLLCFPTIPVISYDTLPVVLPLYSFYLNFTCCLSIIPLVNMPDVTRRLQFT